MSLLPSCTYDRFMPVSQPLHIRVMTTSLSGEAVPNQDLTLRLGYCHNRVITVSDPCHVHIEPVTESYPGHDSLA